MTLTMPSDREFVLTRAFDAARELVWEAWTDPKQVVHWPRGSTTTIERMEVGPRGVVKEYEAIEGANQTMDRLADRLVKMDAEKAGTSR